MEIWTELEQYCESQGMEYKRNASLDRLTTFKVGGPAAFLAEPASREQIAGLLELSKRYGSRTMVLGRGSNLLFSDRGYDGLIIQLGRRFSAITLREGGMIRCQSGASLKDLCRFAQEQGLSGLEFAYGIPGTVGGAVYMNAGAYGGEMKDVLVSTAHLCPDGKTGSYQGEELQLSYRHSAYSDSPLVITEGVFRLQPGDKAEIKAKMESFMARRREKQPLDYPSAGSTFKRPEGAYASALIDQCGLKGRRVGGAQVSEKHAGFVINRGGATCGDIAALIAEIQEEVKRRTGFTLHCEVKIID